MEAVVKAWRLPGVLERREERSSQGPDPVLGADTDSVASFLLFPLENKQRRAWVEGLPAGLTGMVNI